MLTAGLVHVTILRYCCWDNNHPHLELGEEEIKEQWWQQINAFMYHFEALLWGWLLQRNNNTDSCKCRAIRLSLHMCTPSWKMCTQAAVLINWQFQEEVIRTCLHLQKLFLPFILVTSCLWNVSLSTAIKTVNLFTKCECPMLLMLNFLKENRWSTPPYLHSLWSTSNPSCGLPNAWGISSLFLYSEAGSKNRIINGVRKQLMSSSDSLTENGYN